jgi:putative DNA primase/helicase
VCRKFALIASAGEFAIECGILPYEKEDVWKAAEQWFEIWLSQRDSIGDLEIHKVLKRIQDHFAVESEQRYVPICFAKTDARIRKAGYSWDHSSGSKRYLMLSAAAHEILRGINRQVILDELRKRGWIELKDDGNIRDTKSIDGTNHRGYIFIPKAWEEKVDQESTLSVEVLSLDQDNIF